MRRLPGISRFAADVGARIVALRYDAAAVSEGEIRRALEDVGYESTVMP